MVLILEVEILPIILVEGRWILTIRKNIARGKYLLPVKKKPLRL